MLNFFYVTYRIYHNGYLVGTDSIKKLCEQSETIPHEEEITWENLEEKHKKYEIILPFNIWNFKKGRLVSFFHSRKIFGDDVKEWKSPLNIVIKTEYEPYNPSIYEVLKYNDAEKAARYLKENLGIGNITSI